MNQGTDSYRDPYTRLGIERDAAFDAVQAARSRCLQEAGDDPMARSAVEAAYDAVLMDRLKERQQGRVSHAARNASQRELATPPPPRPMLPVLPRLPAAGAAQGLANATRWPSFSLASGRERWFPLAAHGMVLLLLLIAPAASPELLLALATGVTILNLQRRHGRFLMAVVAGFSLLALGLILGALLIAVLDQHLPLGLPLTVMQVQSLPVLLLLLLGALLIS
ncbi:MAG: CPP1-like family protein [Cyanobacteriota bacterium]|jgi:hypothetical protein